MPLDQLHEQPSEKGEMSFFDHIAELRKHILRSVAAIAVVGTVAFLNRSFIFEQLLFGPRRPDFLSYRVLCWLSQSIGLGDQLCIQPTKFTIMTRQLGEVLMQHLSVSFWLGIIGAFPIILWQFWIFIRPGLHKHEQSAIKGIVFICTLLFLSGVLFGYYIIAPFAINFLAAYTVSGMEVSPTLDSYVSYMVMFTFPMGLVFEMPIVFYFLAKIGIIGAKSLRSYRRHAYIAILILAAFITPTTDIASQLIVTTPLIFLYEISIILVARVQRQREQAMASGNKTTDVEPVE